MFGALIQHLGINKYLEDTKDVLLQTLLDK